MTDDVNVSPEKVEELYQKLKREAEAGGYHLNPDADVTKTLVKGLLINIARYSYQSCPCRLSLGLIDEDRDIICPCDYRDADVNQFSTCYCGLYVSSEVVNGNKEFAPIPERRPSIEDRHIANAQKNPSKLSNSSVPVWRCRVCGYLCARDAPPESCPICKAKLDRFERFI